MTKNYSIKKCGFVILNYNSYDLSCAMINNLIEYDIVGQIVLVDNNSSDNFDKFYKKINNKKLIYIKNKENSGYAAGNNIGLKILKEKGYEYAFISNPDVEFDYNTIKKIFDFISNNHKYGIVSCTRTQNHTKATGQFWTIPTFSEALLESVFIGRKFQNLYNRKKSNDFVKINGTKKIIDVEVVGGAFFCCNLIVFEKIGYLDENTFLWYEENIISFKLRDKGYKVGLLLNCEYEHSHKKSGHGNKNHKVFLASKKHYCYNYLKINIFQKVLLYVFDMIGIIENYFICLLFGR